MISIEDIKDLPKTVEYKSVTAPEGYIILSEEAYSDLCLKAAVVEGVRKDLNDIRAEIKRNISDTGDIGEAEGYYNALDIIDRHIGKEKK